VGLTGRVLTGLGAGLALGIVIEATGIPALEGLVPLVEPVGRLWVNAIQMTVVPLVVSLLIVGIASAADLRSVGRIGGRALGLFLLVLAIASTASVLLAAPLLRWLRIDPEATAALREGAGLDPGPARVDQIPTLGEWFVNLVPTNPVAAAAEGQLLPLIVFTVAFGVAVTRVTVDHRTPILEFFRAVTEAMLVLVRWVLEVAPIGVFALAVPLATRLGLAAAGAMVYYVALVSGLCIALIVVLYPVGVVLGRTPLRRLARAMAPPQGVAFSARSALAALPPMIEEAKEVLRLPTSVTGLFLPFSVSIFRPTAPIVIIAGTLFLARLYGVDLGPQELAAVALMAMFMSFSVPAIPGGSILIMAPVLLTAGIPLEGLGILLAIDTVPDMFRTTGNITAHMSLATILARGEAGEGSEDPAPTSATAGSVPPRA
jgi:proton glutamate symport protein